MLRTWDFNPQKRPTFDLIFTEIDELIKIISAGKLMVHSQPSFTSNYYSSPAHKSNTYNNSNYDAPATGHNTHAEKYGAYHTSCT